MVKRALYISLLMIPTLVWGQKKVVFTPQWTAQAQFAGYYIADSLGYYDDFGLDVEIVHPSKTRSATEMLKSGESDFITIDLLTAIAENAKSGNLLNILQTSQLSGLVLVSQSPLTDGFAHLEGKKIGRWKAGFSTLAAYVLRREGVNVEWVDFMGGVTIYLSGAIDATVAMSYNELMTMRETGAVIEDSHIIHFSDIGQNLPEEGLYTLKTMDKESAENFASASKRGWLWATEHPKEALGIVMKWVRQESIPTNEVHQKAMLNEVLRLQYNPKGIRTMKLGPIAFDKAVNMLIDCEIIESGFERDDFILH